MGGDLSRWSDLLLSSTADLEMAGFARALEHGEWVLFEDFFLFLSIRHSLREMRHVAAHQAELQTVNAAIESKVLLPTPERPASDEGFPPPSATPASPSH